jgi:hypothetical protein
LLITGDSQDKADGQGRVERHFARKYKLPDDVGSRPVFKCRLTLAGQLLVSSPKTGIVLGNQPLLPKTVWQVDVDVDPTTLFGNLEFICFLIIALCLFKCTAL